jgi:alkylation response protein AidB-like acyl-CoA dehydrogenase
MRASENDRGHLPELPRPGGADDRRRRAGLHPDAAGARRRAHRHRRAGRRAWRRAPTRRRAYAFERKQFGRQIGTFQSIRWKLVDNAARVEAARLLTYRAAWLKDQGRRTTLESSMAKLYASEIAVRASEDGVQIHGGYGFVKDYPAEKFFRDVKLTTIGEGTSEVQRLVIARQLLAA